MKIITTIEDCLELLCGFKGNYNFSIVSSDHTILMSICRQVIKGTALTDRQYAMLNLKLMSYEDQFIFSGIDNLSECINTLRIPLRSIDRSKWIKLVDSPHENDQKKYFAVRFPFSKSNILLIEDISVSARSKSNYYHASGSHVHYFTLNEKNVYDVISIFQNKQFEIDPQLIDWYNKISNIKNDPDNSIPGVYSFKLKNLHTSAVNYMISSIGEPNITNLAIYKDRSKQFGLEYFDQSDIDQSIHSLTPLSQKIVQRTSNQILINSSVYLFDRVAESLLELHRYPMLVCLDGPSEYNSLKAVNQSFRNIFSFDDSCVLYRKDNDSPDNIAFNQYIKDNNLNNPLAITSKIVYTSINKVTKLLPKSNWKPSVIIMMGSVRPASTMLLSYINEADLVIHYDTDVSPFLQKQVEKI
tara:strand:+ start:42 stop:1283 length:1242 start_codon:yes stop_codon:yes gene_type:complete